MALVRGAIVASMLAVSAALVPPRALPGRTTPRVRARGVTMIISPEAMIAVQKTVNRAKFEATVENYMKTKRVSREEAELEFATYLLDPDAYVLSKASDSFAAKSPTKKMAVKKAEMGARRSPLLQAYIDEGGPEVRERIEKFERDNTTKALVIISVMSAFLLFGKDFVAP
mmetsp:Transcript_16503/g.51670  ORF Transcript_16503/g.51670 Transcript_16503/m.51670 type:complete len:171 (+) Transcript_16503:26-538(+)